LAPERETVDGAPDGAPAVSPTGRVLERLAAGFALAGGGVLLAIAALTVASVIGRALFGAPVLGDFELVEIGTAVAIFAFLPWCHMRGGNVVVDVFTRRLGDAARGRLDGVHNLVFAALAALIAWRMALGGAGLRAAGETSMILRVPLWWAFVPMVAASVLLCVICIYKFMPGARGARR
jgi:TRAP-type C4-dicarboxylate transport system permease small subunit